MATSRGAVSVGALPTTPSQVGKLVDILCIGLKMRMIDKINENRGEKTCIGQNYVLTLHSICGTSFKIAENDALGDDMRTEMAASHQTNSQKIKN